MPTTPTDDLLLKMRQALHAYYNNGGAWAEYEQAKQEYESQAPEHLEDESERVLVQTGKDTIAFGKVGIGHEIGHRGETGAA